MNTELVNLLTTAGPTGLLAVGIVLLFTGRLVLPREIAEREKRIAQLEKERDEFKTMAYQALDIGERITSATEHRDRR